MFDIFSEGIVFTLIRVITVLAAITLHEFAHGFTADKLGDPTPQANGRLSLNPIKHLDPVGTLALFFVGIGWAKPVPVDPFNFENKKRGMALVSLAGPGANFVSAIAVSLLAKFALPLLGLPLSALILVNTAVITFVAISIGLGLFNLIPIPPLDGSKILFSILPNHLAYEIEETLNQYGIIILLFLLFPFGGESIVLKILTPLISFVLSWLI